MDSLLREEQVELAVTCAVSFLGIRRGLTPIQQSRFNTPWVKAPESQEEQFHQDLVWVYKVLPPNDKFNTALAGKGVYKKMRLKALDDFWSNYDPEHKTEKRKHIPLTKYQSHSKGLRPSRPTRTKRSNHA
jgi:hypothetical protein